MNPPVLIAAAGAACLLLCGCAAIPDDPPQERVLEPGSLGLSGPAYEAPDQWWLALDDPQLDRLVQQALARNPGLAGALARVRSAAAQAAAAGAANDPQLAFDANANRERISEHYIFPPPYGGGTYWIAELGVGLGWNLDFWGQQAQLIDQARRAAQAAQFDAAASRLLLSSSVAQSYVELIRARELEELATRVARQRAQVADLARQRVQAGLDTDVERLSAESGVARVEVDREQARLAQAASAHALAALTGSGADGYARLEAPSLDLERALPLPQSLPADLLAHRPDVAAAHARVLAAQAGRDSAEAAFYPNINLAAFIGYQAVGLDRLFDSGSHTWSVGPAIHLPLFEGGRLRAEYRKTGADIDAAVSAYNETILRAVREVADQLSRLDSIERQLGDQSRALTAAEGAYRIAEQRYGAGLSSYLTVLNAETQVFEARRQRVNLLADRTLARMALLVALGGDFQETQP
jgi:NodT family efflux transporter outer membrane factor (OMF) lipoprotein